MQAVEKGGVGMGVGGMGVGGMGCFAGNLTAAATSGPNDGTRLVRLA